MAYGIFESTNIKGKNLSFVYNSDIENGMLVHKGDLVTGSKDIYNAIVPAAGTIEETKVYVIGNPAWNYDTSSIINQNEEEFINKAKKAFRVYELESTDKFGIADYSITPIDGSTPVAVGQFVGLQAGSGKLKASAAEPTGSAFVGKVIAIRKLGAIYHVGQTVDQRMNKVIIEVVKNG